LQAHIDKKHVCRHYNLKVVESERKILSFKAFPVVSILTVTQTTQGAEKTSSSTYVPRLFE